MSAGLCGAFRDISSVSFWVLGATALGLVAITGLPVLAEPFAFAPTSLKLWLAACGIGISAFVPFEIAKWSMRASMGTDNG